MKRNLFITSLFATAAFLLRTLSNVRTRFGRNSKGFKIASGEGRIYGHIKLGGMAPGVLDVKVSGSDGDLAVFLHSYPWAR